MYQLIFLDIESHKGRPWKDLTMQMKQAFVNHHYKPEEDVYGVDNWTQFFTSKPEDEKQLELFIHLKNVERQYNMKAGLIPEFGRVICVSLGIQGADEQLRTICYKGNDEVEILTKLATLLNKFGDKEYGICGWNTNGFDIPFLAKRYIVNGMHCPILLNPIGMKPWERLDKDLMQIWKCSGWQPVSLEVACSCLNLPVKFTEHTGKDLWELELSEMDWDMLEMYCNNDMYSCFLIYKYLDEIGFL